MDTRIYHPKNFNPAILWWVAKTPTWYSASFCIRRTRRISWGGGTGTRGTAPRPRKKSKVLTRLTCLNCFRCFKCLKMFEPLSFGISEFKRWSLLKDSGSEIVKGSGAFSEEASLMAIVDGLFVIARVSQPMVGCPVETSEVGFWIPNAPRIGDVVGDDRGEDGPSQPWLGNLWDIQNGWCPKMTGTKNIDNMWQYVIIVIIHNIYNTLW